MKNKVWSIILVLVLLVLALNFISAQEGCCVKTTEGAWCQMVEQDECASTVAPTSCDSFSQCVLGTCVNVNSGQCSSNVPKAACEANGGFWDPRVKSEVELNGVNVCQDGCCSFGNNVAFVSHTECIRLGSDYGVEVSFDGSITSESICYSTADTGEEGACLISKSTGSSGEEDDGNWFTNLFGGGDEEELNPEIFGLGYTCRRTTRTECNEIGGIDFEEGLLCTAPFLGTDCAKTDKTTCGYGDKVYFKDTCGNIANVYDADMYSDSATSWTPKMEDYWTNIIEQPTCDLSSDPSGCGDCNILEGNICREFSRTEYGMPPEKPDYGEYVCASMGCEYDTNGDGQIQEDENYLHGERWCAETHGTFNHLKIDPETGTLDNQTIQKLSNPNDYNLPGSRYVSLSCYDGEVIEEPCRDFRNEFCVEFEYPETKFRGASCILNDWRACFTYLDEDSCGESQMCKWIPGYRFDNAQVTTQESRNMDEQGSCLPLFSPGFEFWDHESGAEEICSSAEFSAQIVYETKWNKKRDDFADQPVDDAAQRCIDNCYLIPDYGIDINLTKYADFWRGESYGSDLSGKHVSMRKGYYCEGQGGGFGDGTLFSSGDQINCASDSGKSRVFPIFFTHDQWLDSIIDRTRSLGDCGYKQSAYKDLGVEGIDKELELVTIMFQKLKQDGTPKDDGGTSYKLYVGGERSGESDEGREYRN